MPFAANGSYQFNTLVDGVETAPASGRVPNQGFEALTITPDGKTLYAALQSGTVQDGGSEATAGQLTVSGFFMCIFVKHKFTGAGWNAEAPRLGHQRP